MSNNLMKDIGENAEYIKTIINNTIELKKIEIAESTSNVVSIAVMSLILVILSTFILTILLIIGVLLIAQKTGSLIEALAIMIGILLLLILLLYLIRKKILFSPITRFVYSSLFKL